MKQTDENPKVKRDVDCLLEFADLEHDKQPMPEMLKVPATLNDGSEVCVMVEYDNNFVRFNEMYNTMTSFFVRSLFDIATAVALVVNVQVKDEFYTKNTQIVKILDGVMYDRNFRVFITPPYYDCMDNGELLNTYAKDW